MGDVRFAIPDLAEIRKHRGLRLREIAEATKIRVYYLEAIENGEFDKLPGGVYTKSYIRQYANAIDFDESVILRVLPPDVEEERPPARSPARNLMGRLLRLACSPCSGGEPASRRTG